MPYMISDNLGQVTVAKAATGGFESFWKRYWPEIKSEFLIGTVGTALRTKKPLMPTTRITRAILEPLIPEEHPKIDISKAIFGPLEVPTYSLPRARPKPGILLPKMEAPAVMAKRAMTIVPFLSVAAGRNYVGMVANLPNQSIVPALSRLESVSAAFKAYDDWIARLEGDVAVRFGQKYARANQMVDVSRRYRTLMWQRIREGNVAGAMQYFKLLRMNLDDILGQFSATPRYRPQEDALKKAVRDAEQALVEIGAR